MSQLEGPWKPISMPDFFLEKQNENPHILYFLSYIKACSHCCRSTSFTKAMLPPSKQKQIMRRDTGYSRFYAERSVLYILRHRILVAALASLASRCNQASLRLAKGWIAFTNGIFDSREPPIWVPVAARPQDSRYAWPKSKLRPQLYNISQEI